ncbi:hypothetical protein O7632_02720 [Solwaraspora sp. WMMD406]|uniref:hypothetical protein n=1 Tax=Solwaraspora sp. WMMD406 TaxID=3016095 RepID=UPI002417C3EC|nr:hypothetical protein [Solwaraspora sp. WMMD406]MDG4763031.1 hypothetical protein [Solwaraspora sp. WMMD406]
MTAGNGDTGAGDNAETGNAVLELIDRVRPPLRGLIAAGLAAAGGLMLMLGSVLPWVAGPDADAVTYGVAASATGGSALGSRAGIAGGDALVTLLAGIVAVGLAGWYGLGRARRWQQTALFGAASLALAWTVLDFVEVGDTAGPDGARWDIGPGIGLYVCLLGGLAVLTAAGSAPRDVEQDLRVLGHRAEQLAARGLGFEAIEKQQQLLRRARRRPGWQDPRLTFEALYLARLYLNVGHVDRAVRLVHEVMGGADERFGGDQEGLAAARAEAGSVIVDANAQVAAAGHPAYWPAGWAD